MYPYIKNTNTNIYTTRMRIVYKSDLIIQIKPTIWT